MKRIDSKIRRIDQARNLLKHLLEEPGKVIETPGGFYTMENNQLVFIPKKRHKAPRTQKHISVPSLLILDPELAYN
jgi:hypothetical protein